MPLKLQALWLDWQDLLARFPDLTILERQRFEQFPIKLHMIAKRQGANVRLTVQKPDAKNKKSIGRINLITVNRRD